MLRCITLISTIKLIESITYYNTVVLKFKAFNFKVQVLVLKGQALLTALQFGGASRDFRRRRRHGFFGGGGIRRRRVLNLPKQPRYNVLCIGLSMTPRDLVL
jgi:hypothetical protein